MAYGVIQKLDAASADVNSYNRTAQCASAVEDGMVFQLATVSITAGEEQVWTATVPQTSHLTNLWMAGAFNWNLVTSGSLSYRGLNDDPRNFLIPANTPFSAFKPKLGDVYLMNVDAFSGAKGESDTHVNATNNTWQLVWGTSQTADVLSLKLLETTYMSIGGAISNRFTAYRMECVGE